MATTVFASCQCRFAELFFFTKFDKMDSKIGYEMSLIIVVVVVFINFIVEAMCEFHDSNCKGSGDIWLTGKLIYFSSINIVLGASMTNNRHWDCAPLLNYFIHLLLRYDMKKIKHDLFIVLL